MAPKHSEAQIHSLAPACSSSEGGNDSGRNCLHSPTSLPPSALSVSRWVMEEWGTCSRSCGKLGVQTRGVQCLLSLSNGTYKAMPAKACPGDRPEARRPCLRVPCPAQWRTGAWSQVSCLQRVGGTGPMRHLLWRVRWVGLVSGTAERPSGAPCRQFLANFFSPYLICFFSSYVEQLPHWSMALG